MVTIVSSSRYKINRKQIKQFVATVLEEYRISETHTVNIIFAGKTKLKALAKTYKNENVALPVLTFFYNEKSDDELYLGEILICYPQGVLLAAQKNKGVDEMILSLVKHGLQNLLSNLS